MQDPEKQRKTYLMLAVVFGIAGLVWMIYGFFSPRWILFPCIGVLNLAIAWFCKKNSA